MLEENLFILQTRKTNGNVKYNIKKNNNIIEIKLNNH